MMASRNWKRIGDFDQNEREVIAERRKYQSAAELADVFLTTPQTIASICRTPTTETLNEPPQP